MAVDEFGHGMKYDICTQVKWFLEIRAAEGIIDNKGYAMFVGYFCQDPKVTDPHGRIGWGFSVKKFGIRAEGGFDFFRIGSINHGIFNTEPAVDCFKDNP
jgi:hypothetical protein